MRTVSIASYDNYIPAHIAMGRLKEEGIQCWLKDENMVTINPMFSNSIGGIKLLVPEEDAERAWKLLKGLDQDHKTTISCPKCDSHNIEVASTPRKIPNWLRTLLGFFFTSYASPVQTVNHCFNCGHEFIDQPAEKTEPTDLTTG